ncbi:hypothetical protein Y1Q_0016516 [Alligator mississippiensis]|uniref:Uncharacterized protein n=1 Tax=Alligator mississippiensis TaxID=8496 RepID=A0A151N3I6_ALLMI|nr:hypothetical protein Y1Q_0016516 [Alligator mississippiensis]
MEYLIQSMAMERSGWRMHLQPLSHLEDTDQGALLYERLIRSKKPHPWMTSSCNVTGQCRCLGALTVNGTRTVLLTGVLIPERLRGAVNFEKGGTEAGWILRAQQAPKRATTPVRTCSAGIFSSGQGSFSPFTREKLV